MTVLVGVDGSPPSLDALDLALREAALRHTAVRVVCADPWGAHPAWIDAPRPLTNDPRDAVWAAHVHTPTEFSAEILPGEPGAVLVRESAGADLAVVGHRGRGGFPELLLGSVAVKLAAHAQCPVIVTRGPVRPDGGVGTRGPARPDGDVGARGRASVDRDVGVGVDGSP